MNLILLVAGIPEFFLIRSTGLTRRLHSQTLGRYQFHNVSEDYHASYKQIDGLNYLFATEQFWIVGPDPLKAEGSLHAHKSGVLPPTTGWKIDDKSNAEEVWVIDPQLTVVPKGN